MAAQGGLNRCRGPATIHRGKCDRIWAHCLFAAIAALSSWERLNVGSGSAADLPRYIEAS